MGLDSSSSLRLGELKRGPLNKLTDVKGLRVGHLTHMDGDIQTGVTAILPSEGNIFREKFLASSFIINGFGKSVGLMQVDEMGTIETPILLTNTLSVGTATTALAKHMLEENEDIGDTTGSVNLLVFECNDSVLNDMRGLHITEEDIEQAIKNAEVDFSEGAIGAGRGMVCHDLKGGIGSASRVIEVDGRHFSVGALVLSNHGFKRDLILGGEKPFQGEGDTKEEQGSIIVIIATDLPLSTRQLSRLARRASQGLGRTGSFAGNGSGEVVLAFSTANVVPHYPTEPLSMTFLHDNHMDLPFKAVVECVEESVISSLYHAETVTGRNQKTVLSLKDALHLKTT